MRAPSCNPRHESERELFNQWDEFLKQDEISKQSKKDYDDVMNHIDNEVDINEYLSNEEDTISRQWEYIYEASSELLTMIYFPQISCIRIGKTVYIFIESIEIYL